NAPPSLHPFVTLPVGLKEQEWPHALPLIRVPTARAGLDPNPVELPRGLLRLGPRARQQAILILLYVVVLLSVIGEQLVDGTIGVDRPDAHVGGSIHADPELHLLACTQV